MKISLISLIGIFGVIAVGCAKSGDSGAATASCGSKSLKSVWTDPTLSFSFSLANLNLNQSQSLTVGFSGSTKACSGNATMTGSECAGTYAIVGMTWNGLGGADPGCSGLNESGTYSKTSAGLNFTNTKNQSTTYQ